MPTCPACHADLKGALPVAGELDGCPFCGTSLTAVETDSFSSDSLNSEAGTAADNHIRASRHGTRDITAPPAESRIEVVENTPERLVVHIPPGGENTKGLGCFALFWNGFMCIFTPPWFLVGGNGDGPPLFFLIPFLLLFWAIGLGMAYVWLRMKFTRTYLLLEPDRMVVQTQWLRSKKLEEAPLTSETRARLVESYQMNDVPVHRIDIDAEGHTFQFGTRLSEPEKAWLSQSLNRFLKRDVAVDIGTVPQFCWSCGTALAALDFELLEATGEEIICPQCEEPQTRVPALQARTVIPVAEVSTREIPASSVIQIEEDSPDRLAFFLPLLPDGRLRRGIVIVATLVGLVWVGIAGFGLMQALLPAAGKPIDWFDVIFRVIPLLPGIAVLWLGASLKWSRIRVSIDRDWLRVRYQSGFLWKGMRFATSAIDSVRLRTPDDFERSGRDRQPNLPIPGTDGFVTATVQCGKSFLPLTTFHARDEAQLVAGLVKHRLQEFGVQLSNGSVATDEF